MNPTNYRNQLMKKFQINGLNVRQDAMNIFESEFQHGQPPYQSIDDFINNLTDKMLTELTCEDYIINVEIAQKAIKILRESRQLLQPNLLNEKKIIVTNSVELGQSLGTNFEFHYQQLLHRLKKLPVFESGQFSLMTIDELNTYDSNIEIKCIVFAMIRKDPSTILQFFLEDSTGKIPVQLNSEIVWREWATFQHGIYLIEGIYDGQSDFFQITSIGLPPSLIPLNSISGTVDDNQNKDDDRMLVLLSDIYLDEANTIEALKFLFNGYNSLQQVPDIFLLIGNFSSTKIDTFDFKDNMKKLIKLISTFQKLSQNSKFIFVPGPDDPSASISTNDSFIKYQFTSDHFPTTTTRIKNFHLPSNPFYLKFNNKNLCIFSNRIISKYAKNLINNQKQFKSTDISKNNLITIKNFLKSIARLQLTNAHLTSGLSRTYSSLLSLISHTPDMLILSDNELPCVECKPFENSSFCLTTTKSFSKNNFQFFVYYSNENCLEESQINI